MRLVVDASVTIKMVIEEPDTPAALRLAHSDLHAPDFIMIECANVLWKKRQRRELEDEEAGLASSALENALFTLYPARLLLPRALRLGLLLDHAIYDCVYLSLAEQLGAPLMTADETLCNKLPTALPVRVLRLRDSSALVP